MRIALNDWAPSAASSRATSWALLGAILANQQRSMKATMRAFKSSPEFERLV
jgi:hypothetical protein